jgi:hypothetical protein
MKEENRTVQPSQAEMDKNARMRTQLDRKKMVAGTDRRIFFTVRKRNTFYLFGPTCGKKAQNIDQNALARTIQ